MFTVTPHLDMTKAQWTPSRNSEYYVNTFLQKGLHKQYIIWCNSTWQGHTHPHTYTHTHISMAFFFSSWDCTAVSEPFCPSHTAESRHTRGRGDYLHSFIQYCTYWPIASHSKCCDDASKSVTQWHLYIYICIYTYVCMYTHTYHI